MRRLLLLIILSCGLLGSQVFAQVPDVRVAIDISGSMKQTDPHNLRKPAMELLVQLLPDNSHAGIWTFGQQVNMLVPHRSVDASWRQQALPKAAEISSVALYTNIGAVLKAVSFDRETLSPTNRNSIILLTDGMVDISPDDDVNARERQRILDDLLPVLQQAGYRIHTIALSELADKDLMRALSQATGGVAAIAQTADELMSVFIRIFDQAVPQERLPLDGKGFLVDDSVVEFTALIFRAPGSETQLLTPEGRRLDSGTKLTGVNWYRAEAGDSGRSYDLITVSNPSSGNWQLASDIGPDSRITVISNLQLQVVPPPTEVLVGQEIRLEYVLQENGVIVTDEDFLSLLSHRISLEAADLSDSRRTYDSPHSPRPGQYQQSLDGPGEPGDYRLSLLVDGKTFRREFVWLLTTQSLFAVDMEKLIDGQQVHYQIRVNAPESVNHQRTSLVAHIKNSEGLTLLRTLELADNNSWTLTYTPEQRARYSIRLQVSGQLAEGGKLQQTLPTQYFTYPEEGDPYIDPDDLKIEAMLSEYREQLAEEIAAVEAMMEAELAELQAEVIVEEETPAEAEPDMPAEPEATRWWIYLLIGLVNIGVLAGAFWAYRKLIGGGQLAPLDTGEEEGEAGLAAAGEPLAMQAISTGEEAGEEAVDEALTPVAEPETRPAEPVDIDDDSLDALFPFDDADDYPDEDASKKPD